MTDEHQNTDTQDTAREISRLTQEIQKLKHEIDSSYYRIPKQEFENITVQNITHQVSERINKKFTTISSVFGGIVVLLSFFGITQLDRVFQFEVSQAQQRLESDLESKIRSELAILDREMDAQMRSVTLLKDEIDQKLDQQLLTAQSLVLEKLNEETEKRQKQLNQAQSIMYRAKLDAITSQLDKSYQDNRTKHQQALEALTPLLEEVTELNDTRLVSEYLDALFRWNFNLGNYEVMDKDRKTYEQRFELTALTWANIAIADMFLYEESGSPIQLRRAREASTKALDQLPSYGVPLAVNLILHTINIERAKDNTEKQVETEQAKEILRQLNSGSHLITSYEAYHYLKKLELDQVAQKYVATLNKTFATEVTILHERYLQHSMRLQEAPAAGTPGKY
ncbi:MAG: hypothetical protein MI976_11680 [Pseudomonadales bacterium]|nr:hypothetical protein [Pseudomonadales bacterium]